MKKELVRLFESYICEFSTLGGFAEYYHLSIDKARRIVKLGNDLYLRGA